MTIGLVFMEECIGSLNAGILDRSVNGKGSWESFFFLQVFVFQSWCCLAHFLSLLSNTRLMWFLRLVRFEKVLGRLLHTFLETCSV